MSAIWKGFENKAELCRIYSAFPKYFPVEINPP